MKVATSILIKLEVKSEALAMANIQTRTSIKNMMVPTYVQGDPKKMHHKDSDLKSVLEVRFYFSTCVLESEFRARFI